MSNSAKKNIFLSGSLGRLYLITAAPIVFVMLANGVYTLVDAYFLGKFVGADALTAVTLMFPIFMILVAFSSWVSHGFSSKFARLLGAGAYEDAGQAYLGATILAVIVAGTLIVSFAIFGVPLSNWISNGSPALAEMGWTYMSILMFTSPLMFILNINIDALRCEGKMPQMAAITLGGTILNVIYNYILIVLFEMGVAGSAIGTVAAQSTSLLAIIIVRKIGGANFPLFWNGWQQTTQYWREFLALGLTPSLGNFGVSMMTITALYSLQKFGTQYEITAGAWGIMTRINAFTFLPMLGIAIGMQTIVGNNYGAKYFERSNRALKIGLGVAFTYNVCVQLFLFNYAHRLGFWFVDDAAISAEIGHILPITTSMMFLFGVNMLTGMYFTAIGDPVRAAIIGLSRTFLFAIPSIILLPYLLGEDGIWYAQPVSELLLLSTVITVLILRQRKTGYRFGLFQ